MNNDRPIFWPVFWGMFAALMAFNVLKWGLAALFAAGLVASWNANKPLTTTPGHLPARYDHNAPARQQARPHREDLPKWPGPSTAVRNGTSRACINGVIADRVNNGWIQAPREPCVATSP